MKNTFIDSSYLDAICNKNLSLKSRNSYRMRVYHQKSVLLQLKKSLRKEKMSHAETCPVCKKKGKVVTKNIVKKCHGCDGYGWITVYDGNEYNQPTTFTGNPFDLFGGDFTGSPNRLNWTNSADDTTATADGDFTINSSDGSGNSFGISWTNGTTAAGAETHKFDFTDDDKENLK